MKRLLKIIGVIFLLSILSIGVLYLILNEEEPIGFTDERADVMAQKMLQAINVEAWNALPAIEWTFAGRHHFKWNKSENKVEVSWPDHQVFLDLNTKNGRVLYKNEMLEGKKKSELLETAWEYFCNDSFWLNAPSKIMDDGTTRSVVELEDGIEALKVKYSSGGVTPGDSYLWILDEDGLPSSYKMWTQIIPIGGLEFTWEKWITLPGGALISTRHSYGALTIDISDIKTP